MGEFRKVIKELKKILSKILLFDIFVESLLIYLCLYLFLYIMNFYKEYAIFPAGLYFVIMIYKRRSLTSIKAVEQKYPILNEALTTASDTSEEDNYVVNELRIQVKQKMQNVSASSFIDIGGDTIKVALVIVFVFLIMGVSICQGTSAQCRQVLTKVDAQEAVAKFDVQKIKEYYEENIKKDGAMEEVDMGTFSGNDEYNPELGQGNSLLRSAGIAELGSNQLKINIRLANDQIDIRDVSDKVTDKTFMDSSIGSIGITGDANYEDNIRKEHRDIVKNYFTDIRK